MDIIYITTKYKITELKNLDELKKILPKRIGLASLSQYSEIAKIIEKELKKEGFEILTKEGLYGINVLGCYSVPADVDSDTILLIGNGKFHAENIIRNYNKRVIIYDPVYGTINEINSDNNFNKKILILISKLKNSKNVGILLTIKPGQYYYKESLKIKDILEKKGKKVYLFITDTIDNSQFQNFLFIDFWIISACPRFIDDILDKNINGLTIDLVFKNIDYL